MLLNNNKSGTILICTRMCDSHIHSVCISKKVLAGGAAQALPVSAQEVEVPGQEIKRLLAPLGIIPKVLLHVADQLIIYTNPVSCMRALSQARRTWGQSKLNNA